MCAYLLTSPLIFHGMELKSKDPAREKSEKTREPGTARI
jgi:hypothetical protein